MITLENSYCRPTTEEEWAGVSQCIPLGYRSCHQKDAVTFFVRQGKGSVTDFIPLDRSEIPVSKFLDLVHDRIAPWRLEERGYECGPRNVWSKSFNQHNPILIEWCDGMVSVGGRHTSIDTMTDLSNQERYLTPKP